MALDLNDKSGNGNNLTNVNGATEVTTSLPFAASSEAVQVAAASSQYLTAADSASLSITGNMTLEFWFKITAFPTDGNLVYLLAKDNRSTQRSFGIYLNHAGAVEQFAAFITDNAGNFDEYYIDIAALSLNTWYHMAITITPGNPSASTFEFFQDGVSKGNGIAITANNIAAIADTTALLSIGASGIGTLPCDAQFDEVRVWNIIRTITQIANNKSVELVGNETGLVAYYPFESFSSPSASLSPSASISPSISPSASTSPSASRSPSASASPSPSLSPSPSQGYSDYTRGGYSVLPSNNNDLTTMYSEQEKGQVATRDQIYVPQDAALQYMVHQFKNFVGSNTSCAIEWEGKSTLAPEDSTVYLQIYNQNTHQWETKAVNSQAEENQNFELEAKIEDVTNYKDAGQVISCRVYQLAI